MKRAVSSSVDGAFGGAFGWRPSTASAMHGTRQSHPPLPGPGEGGVHFVVSAIATRGDGVDTLLHEPLTATNYNFFRFDLAPDGEGLDLVVPQLDLRPLADGGSSSANDTNRWLVTEGITCSLAADPL